MLKRDQGVVAATFTRFELCNIIQTFLPERMTEMNATHPSVLLSTDHAAHFSELLCLIGQRQNPMEVNHYQQRCATDQFWQENVDKCLEKTNRWNYTLKVDYVYLFEQGTKTLNYVTQSMSVPNFRLDHWSGSYLPFRMAFRPELQVAYIPVGPEITIPFDAAANIGLFRFLFGAFGSSVSGAKIRTIS